MEKNYEDINTTVSFSVLRCFRSAGYLLLIIADERMYLLSINTKEGGTQKKCPRPVFFCCVHIPSRFVKFCHSAISNYFQNHCFLRLFLHLSIILRQIIDIVMMSKWFCYHFIEPRGSSSTCSVGGTSATLWTALRINPYNWTFPNCIISFIMDQSTNKAKNKWLLQVAYGKTCPTFAALQKKKKKKKNRKVWTDILLADLVCFEVQCLPRTAHLKIFKIFVILMTSF